MTHDFSSPEKIAAFLKTQDQVSTWSQPIPNLKWITEAEFAHSSFFYFEPTKIFIRAVAKDQLPEDFVDAAKHARLILTDAVSGFVILSEYARGRIHYGTFAFCEHRNQKIVNLGRCYNRHDCLDCGHSWTIDSSD